MSAGLVAGVDCSTQSTKVLVVDPEDGRIVGQGAAPHRVSGTGGARETDPLVWWNALRDAFAQTARSRDVRALAVAGQQHGLVALDESGAPVHPAVLWNDTRSARDAAELVEALGGPGVWAESVGSVPVASFTVTKWSWLRRVDAIAAKSTARVRLPHDYLTELITGRAVTDRGDASGTGWWSTATESYAAEVLELAAIQLDPRLLPEVIGPTDVAGEVAESASTELGVRSGALVGPGTGDNMGAALGLGLAPGSAVISLGTSGTAYVASETRAADPSGIVAGFADAAGRFLPLACTLNCTLAVDRIAQWLSIDREAVSRSTDVIVLPYFDGERTPNLPDASATITNLRHDTAPGAILLAAYEGAVAGLLDALEALDANSSGIDPHAPLILIGGGARGAVWQHVVARLSGRAVRVPAAGELVALGAAAQAASLLAEESPSEVARRWGTTGGIEIEPDGGPDLETRERIARFRTASFGV